MIDPVIEEINKVIEENKEDDSFDDGAISDGYHTFDELYEYRKLYNAAFFNNLTPQQKVEFKVHKSERHYDGEFCFGGTHFIVVCELPTGQISNHYKLEDWDMFKIPEQHYADEWDGHTPEQAKERLQEYILNC